MWVRHAFIPLDAYPFTFGAPATGPNISQSRAVQGKGLRMQDRFLTHLECSKIEGMIGGQMLRGSLIESDTPPMLGAKINKTTCYLLMCFWRANRVTKHDRDLAHQLVANQSCATMCQEMPVFRSQTKE